MRILGSENSIKQERQAMIDRYAPNTALFTGTDCEEAVTEAREYIKKYGYTAEDVKLVKRDGVVQVITKREIVWKTTS